MVNLKVYPVPARDILYFESDRKIQEIRILDINGRIVHNSQPGKSKFEINIQDLAKSAYIYQIKTEDNQVLAGRLIIF
jgi:hypothetical protein